MLKEGSVLLEVLILCKVCRFGRHWISYLIFMRSFILFPTLVKTLPHQLWPVTLPHLRHLHSRSYPSFCTI
jgi:hypothetical protein